MISKFWKTQGESRPAEGLLLSVFEGEGDGKGTRDFPHKVNERVNP